jgi:nucleoside-diphosphate-sugar epimerase
MLGDPVVILGLGFTTRRLARRLRQRDVPVYAVVRHPERFRDLEGSGVHLCPLACASPQDAVPQGAVMVHSVPPLPDSEKLPLRVLIERMAPRRILYISSTGVYGAQSSVSEESLSAPDDDKGRARTDEEQWIASPDHSWSSLILRSAAIYGPGRGVHVKIRENKLPRGVGGTVSRIHVDDLVAILDAGIESGIEGAWPVADYHPAPSEEVAAWCANRMGIAMPDAAWKQYSVTGRSVDGRKILEVLGVELRYTDYRAGVEASLLEESGPGTSL